MMDIPTVSNIPFVDTAQMVEVDRAMMEDYEILLMQMMENAGRNLAHLARIRFFNGDPRSRSVVVMAGTGGNGGGGLVAARRLHNYGANVTVYLSAEDENFAPIPQHQLDILRNMELDIRPGEEIAAQSQPDLILDAVIGYSLKGAPYGTPKTLIEWANQSRAVILSLDAPSGIDTTSGQVFDPAIKATATMTLALPKAGFRAAGVAAQLGELYLADISVPSGLYAKPPLNIDVHAIFAESDIVRVLL
ncbi:MAG: NAD(P)H-hydrate epimerase [Chloroflexota bacterium]